MHVWAAALPGAAPGGDSLLDEAERRRAAAILQGARREQWVAARALLRVLLGSYLGLPAERVELFQAPGAAPRLRTPGPAFAVSHSRGIALYAFAARGAVAVDVERVRGRAGDALHAVAARAFGASRAAELQLVPATARERAFLRDWVRLEAARKLSASGVFGPPPPAGQAPWLFDLLPADGCPAALAMARAPGAVRRFAVAEPQRERPRGSERPTARSSDPRPRPSRESSPIAS